MRSIEAWRDRMVDFANGDRISDNETHCTDVNELLSDLEQMRALMGRYAAHVLGCEGVDYLRYATISGHTRWDPFTDDEVALIRSLADKHESEARRP